VNWTTDSTCQTAAFRDVAGNVLGLIRKYRAEEIFGRVARYGKSGVSAEPTMCAEEETVKGRPASRTLRPLRVRHTT
jgi:hypothetical protein